MSIVELLPRPGGGTTLRHTVRAEPRGWLGAVAGRVELGFKAKRSLGRVYRRIDAALDAADPVTDPFELPTRLPAARQRRLEAGLRRLSAAGASTHAVDLLGIYLANAPAQELRASARWPWPVASAFLVRRWPTPACAAREGLLLLEWDIICPLCRIPSDRKDTLRASPITPTAPPAPPTSRPTSPRPSSWSFRFIPTYGPRRSAPIARAGRPTRPTSSRRRALRPASGSTSTCPCRKVSTACAGRSYPGLPTCACRRTGPCANGKWILSAPARPASPVLAVGGQVLTLRNGRSHELVVRVERATARDDALTAAQATALPAFRDLFPHELLSPGQLARAATVTLLLTQLDEGETLFERLGESAGFQLLQASLRRRRLASAAGAGPSSRRWARACWPSFRKSPPPCAWC